MEIQATRRSRALSRWAATCGVAVLFTAGCNRMEDSTTNFTKAINKYYSTHPSCLWETPIKFPVQEDTSDIKATSGYDALVYQGLLARSSGEKKVMIIASKQVTFYDLADKGRASWVVDPQQPGFGNFCYGHRSVTSIDSSSPTTSKPGATTDVVYRYSVTGVPDWAKAAETQTAYPELKGDLSGNQVGRATLTDTRKGWQVTSAPWAHISDSDIYQ